MKMDMERKDTPRPKVFSLRVKMSPISGSGIARINRLHLRNTELEEGKPVMIMNGDRKRIMRLVADEMMERGKISIRRKDMDKLRVSEGDEVMIQPLKNVGERLSHGLSFLRKSGDGR